MAHRRPGCSALSLPRPRALRVVGPGSRNSSAAIASASPSGSHHVTRRLAACEGSARNVSGRRAFPVGRRREAGFQIVAPHFIVKAPALPGPLGKPDRVRKWFQRLGLRTHSPGLLLEWCLPHPRTCPRQSPLSHHGARSQTSHRQLDVFRQPSVLGNRHDPTENSTRSYRPKRSSVVRPHKRD